MPRGSQHALTGLLLVDDHGFALDVDGGGRWRLEVRDDRAAARSLGRRVAVTGRRGGFDLLEVATLTQL